MLLEEKGRGDSMAYMCPDSGNLMAIAQQVIQQQQQNSTPSINSSPTTQPWGAQYHHSAIAEHFSFTMPDPIFSDSADHASLTFAPPDHSVPFRLSGLGFSAAVDFESDEWMESLIAHSPTDSSDPLQHAHGGCDLPPLFYDPAIFLESHRTMSSSAQIQSFDASSPPIDPTYNPTFSKQKQEPPAPNSLLLKSLLDCALIADSNPSLAARSLDRIRHMTSETGDPTQRLAFYFAEALHRRLSPSSPPPTMRCNMSPEELTLCYKTLSDACPYSNFAHLTANQSLLEATESSSKIHIIDFGIVQGVQWAALLQALATRPAGKPSKVRISGIPSPSAGGSSLAATGNRLRDFASLLNLQFDFIPVRNIGEIVVEPDEVVVVNFMLQLHHMLDGMTESVEKAVRLAKSFRPKLMALCEYELCLNRGEYPGRFERAMEYWKAAFESVEAAMERDSPERRRVERRVFGHRIERAVGTDTWRERMEGMDTWREVMEGCGMEAVGMSNYAVSQSRILLWSYDYSSKYGVVEGETGSLSLSWEGKPLLTVSAWR